MALAYRPTKSGGALVYAPTAYSAPVLVGAELACSYAIEAAPVILVGADLVCSYDIEAVSATLVGTDLVCSYEILADPEPVFGVIDASKIPPARIVIFTGGIRTVVFTGGIRTVAFARGT